MYLTIEFKMLLSFPRLYEVLKQFNIHRLYSTVYRTENPNVPRLYGDVTPSASGIPINYGPSSKIPLSFELESRILINMHNCVYKNEFLLILVKR